MSEIDDGGDLDVGSGGEGFDGDVAGSLDLEAEMGPGEGEALDAGVLYDATGEFEEVGTEIDGYEAMLEGVNPNFDPFDMDNPYATNCGSCTLATELRLSGVDAEAIAGTVNVSTVDEMNAATGMEQVSMTPAEIEAYAREQGPGYHGIVGFDWAGTNSGHWINIATSETGRVYALDAQCGRAMLFSEYMTTYAKEGVNWDLSIPVDTGKDGR